MLQSNPKCTLCRRKPSGNEEYKAYLCVSTIAGGEGRGTGTAPRRARTHQRSVCTRTNTRRTRMTSHAGAAPYPMASSATTPSPQAVETNHITNKQRTCETHERAGWVGTTKARTRGSVSGTKLTQAGSKHETASRFGVALAILVTSCYTPGPLARDLSLYLQHRF